MASKDIGRSLLRLEDVISDKELKTSNANGTGYVLNEDGTHPDIPDSQALPVLTNLLKGLKLPSFDVESYNGDLFATKGNVFEHKPSEQVLSEVKSIIRSLPGRHQ